MDLETKFVPVDDFEALARWRSDYLDCLPEPQEMLLEVMLPRAAHYFVQSDDRTCGYFSVHEGDTLIEFHLDRAHWVFAEVVFKQIVARLQIKRVLVKSYDYLLLSSSIAHQTRVKSLGLIARDYVPRALPTAETTPFTVRTAVLADLPRVAAIDQNVFTDPSRLEFVIENGLMLLFEREDSLLGFGIVRPIVAGRPDVDLGLALDVPYRNQGQGLVCLCALMEHCRERGLRPVAGCAEENLASRFMAERSGMVARHRLLELTL